MKLGNMQVKILQCLAEYKIWPGTGWIWNNYSTTDKILFSMVKHDLVAVTGKDLLGYKEYRITKAGIKLVKKWKSK